MVIIDENLYNLQQKTARMKHLKSTKNSLYEQRRELDKNRFQLSCAMNKEQADVEKLNKPSLTTFFYRLTGKLDEKLSQEQKEAYEAALRYNTAMQDIERIDHKIKEIQTELDTLKNAESEYQEALEAKKDDLKKSNSKDTEELLNLEKQLVTLAAQEKEINEAISAGSRCLYAVNDVITNLKKASDWGTWDVIGGGTMSTVMKHDYLHKAQSSVGLLQAELRYFRSELADVKIYSHIFVNMDGFTQFADIFFDSIFVDLSVQDRIRSSMRSVTDTKGKIQSAVSKLNWMLEENEEKQNEVRQQIETLLIGK